MDDEKLAFEAMMNEIGDDSDSDSEFDFTQKKAPRKAPSKAAHSSEHDYHQSKSHAKSDSHFEDLHYGGRHSPPPPSKISKTHATTTSVATSKEAQHALEIDNFGAKSTTRAVASAAANQHSDYLANKSWLMRPCHPHDPTTQCYVIREKNMVGGLTLRLYIEPKNDIGEFYTRRMMDIIDFNRNL